MYKTIEFFMPFKYGTVQTDRLIVIVQPARPN